MKFQIPNSKFQIPQSGQIILLAIVFMAVVTTIVVALVSYAQVQIKSQRQAVTRESGLNIAEAAIELALWKLNNQPGYSGETNTSYGGGVYNITVTNISGNSKLIKADAFVPNSIQPTAHRTIQVTVTTGTENIAFNYGVQVGQGGIEMSNTSRIIGNVYANGDIIGQNSARITGTAIVAGSGKIDDMQIDQDANAHFIEDSQIGGNSTSYDLKNSTVGANAVTTTMSGCTVGANATYDTKVSCTIGGNLISPNPDDYQDQENIPLPIDDAQIAVWEQTAFAGGVIGSQTYSSGTTSLGPKKINGDLIVKNTAILNVTGTLWVTGAITFENSVIVRLDASYGGLSDVIIAGTTGSSTAGLIELKNSSQINGSGISGSYLMLISEKNGIGSTAINAGNSGSAAILYSNHGLIDISNSGQFKEITAYQMSISNSATVTYESGLANSQFSSGPAGGWEILNQTYQLLR